MSEIMVRDGTEAATATGADGSWQSKPIWLFRLLFAATALAVWQLASGRLVDPFWVSSPSAIIARLAQWIANGSLQHHLWVTLYETLVGFLIGSICGVAAASILGINDMVRRTIDPFALAIYGVPKVALAPLFIMWFGIGLAPKIVLAAVSVFFLVFFNTLGGIREVDVKMVEALRMMGAGRLKIQRYVILPGSLPWIFLGLKLGLPYGFVGAVAAEMMASNAGIGFLTQNSAGQLDTAGVFAALFALIGFTSLLNECLGRLESWIFRWR